MGKTLSGLVITVEVISDLRLLIALSFPNDRIEIREQNDQFELFINYYSNARDYLALYAILESLGFEEQIVDDDDCGALYCYTLKL